MCVHTALACHTTLTRLAVARDLRESLGANSLHSRPPGAEETVNQSVAQGEDRVDSLRKTYILRVWSTAPTESSVEDSSGAASPTAAEGQTHTGERFYCSLQAIASEEIHYFASLEETIQFIRNNAIAFRFMPR